MRIVAVVVIASLIAAGACFGAQEGMTPSPSENVPPVATIRSPADGSYFVVGRTVALIGSATDREDPAGSLKYQWTVDLLRNDGVEHGFFTGSEPSVFFAAEDLDAEPGLALEIQLVVTDRGGSSDTTRTRIYPRISTEPTLAVVPGDFLEIAYHAGGEKQEQFTAEVAATGTITSPLLGEVSVSGLTATEVATKLTALLGRDFFVNPQVMVSLKDRARKVFVGGEVKSPGAYSIKEGSTVLNVCILAGGFTDFASLNRVTVTRNVGQQTKIMKLDLKEVQRGRVSDLALETGDRIDVPHRTF